MKNSIIVAVVVALLLVVMWQTGLLGRTSSGYQAVFLTNDQVYFGKVSNQSAQYVKLTDIYYLQTTQQLQPSGQPLPALALVKLGNELHGPKDEMRVNRDQILFIEDLKEDSQVVSAITRAKTQQATPSPTPSQ